MQVVPPNDVPRILPNISDYELKVLASVRGDQVSGLIPGAAMWQAIEFLQEEGLVTRGLRAVITIKGERVLYNFRQRLHDPLSDSIMGAA